MHSRHNTTTPNSQSNLYYFIIFLFITLFLLFLDLDPSHYHIHHGDTFICHGRRQPLAGEGNTFHPEGSLTFIPKDSLTFLYLVIPMDTTFNIHPEGSLHSSLYHFHILTSDPSHKHHKHTLLHSFIIVITANRLSSNMIILEQRLYLIHTPYILNPL